MAPLAAATAVKEPSNNGLKLMVDCPLPLLKVDMNARRVTFVPESLLADLSAENTFDAIFHMCASAFCGILLRVQVVCVVFNLFSAKRKFLGIKETIICQTRSDAKPLYVETRLQIG